MNNRLATLLNREDATTAATKVIDINVLEPISAFSIQFRGTNNGSTPTACPAKMIKLVELVDGSDVLESLSGVELQALNICEANERIYYENNYIDNQTTIAALTLNFGRFLYDEQLALDPNKFKNLQLRLTHDKALGGSAPDAGALSVFAHTFDEKVISPVGFLVNREIMSYAMVSSAHQYIDLPVSYPVRKLMIKSLFAGKQPYEQYNKITLFTDEQKKVFINNVNVSDLLRCFAPQSNPYFEEKLRCMWTTGNVTHYCVSTFDTAVAGAPDVGEAAYLEPLASYGGTVGVKGSAAATATIIATGKCPHGMFVIPFGKELEMGDWFDTRKIGSWKLDITAGDSVGSGSTCEIITQQVRSY
jgi:hypothetical protein